MVLRKIDILELNFATMWNWMNKMCCNCSFGVLTHTFSLFFLIFKYFGENTILVELKLMIWKPNWQLDKYWYQNLFVFCLKEVPTKHHFSLTLEKSSAPPNLRSDLLVLMKSLYLFFSNCYFLHSLELIRIVNLLNEVLQKNFPFLKN